MPNNQNQRQSGRKGGRSSQERGRGSNLTQEDRSRGGSMSGGNFKNDPDRASEEGRRGGSM